MEEIGGKKAESRRQKEKELELFFLRRLVILHNDLELLY